MGTQLFQNLLEAGIFMIVMNLKSEKSILDWEFLQAQPNVSDQWCKLPEKYVNCIKVLPAKGYRNSKKINIALNQEIGKTVIYFT